MAVNTYLHVILTLSLIFVSSCQTFEDEDEDKGIIKRPHHKLGIHKGVLIAIIVVGIVAFLFIVIGIILCTCYHRIKRRRTGAGGEHMAMTHVSATPRPSSGSTGDSRGSSQHAKFAVTTYEPAAYSSKRSSRCSDKDSTLNNAPIQLAPVDPEAMMRDQEYLRGLQKSPADREMAHYIPSKRSSSCSGPASPRSLGSPVSEMDCSSSDEYAEDDYLSDMRRFGDQQRFSRRESNENRLNTLRRRFHNVLHNKTIEEQLDMIFLSADFCAGIFDHKGGYLDIPDTSVNLYIPPGALPEGSMQEIYIYLNHYDGMNGTGDGSSTSPIIRCGPPGLQFQEGIFGVVLSFPSAHNNAPFSLYTKESGGDLDQGWTNLTEKNADRCFTDGQGNVHLMLNHFSDFKTEKHPEDVQTFNTRKGLKLGAFGKPYLLKQDSFHMFVCMFKPSEQKRVDEEAARRLGYYPIQDGNNLMNINENDPVELQLTDLKNGWQLMYSDESDQVLQGVSDHQIISKRDFNVRRESESTDHTGGVHFRIIARSGSQVVKMPIHVSEGWRSGSVESSDDESMKSDAACSLTDVSSDRDSVNGKQRESLGTAIFGRMSKKISNHLSPLAYYELCLELNAQRYPPTDWRLLMAKLGLNEMRYIHAIQHGREAGAVVVINLFFSQNKGEEALEKLHAACQEMRLYTAVGIIERDQPQLRLDNTGVQSTEDTTLLSQTRPDRQIGLLPDVTQHSSPQSLSQMMTQMILREEPTEQPPLPVPSNNNNMEQGIFPDGQGISRSETQGISIDAVDTQVHYGNNDMFPDETYI